MVYLICEPATWYFRVMARAERMPMLVGEAVYGGEKAIALFIATRQATALPICS